MSDEDLIAEYGDDEINDLRAAQHRAEQRVISLQDQVQRAEEHAEACEKRVRCWLLDLRTELLAKAAGHSEWNLDAMERGE